MNDENKEEVKKDVVEENTKVEESIESEENDKVEENTETTELKTQEPETEVAENSEKYYDEIDYQEKEATEKIKKKTRSVLREVLDWILCFVVAYIIYLNINYFLISAPGVQQHSMYPTVQPGERVLVLRSLLYSDLEYGDIVTFEAPIDNKYYIDSEDTYPIAQYEQYTGLTLFLYKFVDLNKVTYIKRVIGVAGDHIEIKDGSVYRNGEKLEETYTRTSETTSQEEEYSDVIVPEGTIYVMGDNRAESKDSRSFGCIPLERVSGKVVCRIWPLSKIGSIE